MITYKHLAADTEQMQAELNDYITDYSGYQVGFTKLSIPDLFHAAPSLSKWFDTLGCAPISCYIIRTPPGSSKENAHVDNWVGKPVHEKTLDSKYALAINVPIKNTELTRTAFYEYIDGPVKNLEFGSFNIVYRYYGKANLKEIDSYSLTEPVILNTSIPHSVINPTDKDRFVLTFRFEVDPWYLF
jgi:hypothetical protein